MALGKRSDGKSYRVVAPTGGVVAGRFVRANGINGVAFATKPAGEAVALDIDTNAVFEEVFPGGVSPAAGDTVYIPAAGKAVADVTLTASGNVRAMFVVRAKNAQNVVQYRLLNG